jgi:hypothetical protein
MIRNKNYGLSLLMVLFSVLFSWTGLRAQNTPVQDRLKAQQVAFFTEKLDLTPAEARKFWPVYDDYSNRKETIRIEGRNLLRSVYLNGDNMSDEEIRTTMQKYLDNQNREHALLLEYNKKFQEILPPRKVLMIYVAENQFKQYLLNQIRENRRGGRGPGRF